MGDTGMCQSDPVFAADCVRLCGGCQPPTESITGTTDIEGGKWYHITVTYDADERTLALYVDDQLESTGTGVDPFVGTGHVLLARASNPSVEPGVQSDATDDLLFD